MHRKLPNWLFIGIVLTSLVFMILSSEEPVIPFLQGTFVQSVLVSSLSGNEIIFSLSMGIVVSSIFYLIVVYLPEKQKKSDIVPQINQYISQVVSRSKGFVADVLKHSGKELDLKTLSEEEFLEACKSVNPTEITQKFHDGGAGIFERHFGYACYNQWQLIEKNINDVMHFLPYVDTGVVKILNKMRSSTFSMTVGSLRDVDKLKNSDMSAWAPCIYKVFELSRELENYYRRHVDKEFRIQAT